MGGKRIRTSKLSCSLGPDILITELRDISIHATVCYPRLGREGVDLAESHLRAAQNCYRFATFRGSRRQRHSCICPAAMHATCWSQY